MKNPKLSAVLLILLLGTAVMVSSCAELDALRVGIASHGADAADRVVEDALWVLCEAAPVASILRYFDTTELRQAYEVICKAKLPDVDPDAPPG